LHEEVFRPHIEQIWGWDEEWQRINFASEFESTVTSVIEIDGRVGGYIQVRDEKHRLYLQNIALIPDFQSKGIGGELVAELQARARVRGIPLELAVFRTNISAQRFYARCGFRTAAESEAFVEMSWNDENASLN
jgi:ribosomal protein S18 acetylase RimI-like enzyme